MDANFSERLVWVVKQKSSGNQARFAKEAGIAPGTFHAYTQGRLPQAEQLIRMHEKYGVNITWLLTGDGKAFTADYDRTLVETAVQTKCLDAEEYLLVPLLQSWIKGGPEGRLIYEGIADHYPFKRYFIEKLVGATPDRHKELYLARVKGDSMAPTINDNEIILFDTNEVERLKVRTGQIYVVQLPEGSVTVKRLSLSVDPQGARLICHSDNLGVYKMFDFNLDPGRPIHSYVLGRVRWAGKEFD